MFVSSLPNVRQGVPAAAGGIGYDITGGGATPDGKFGWPEAADIGVKRLLVLGQFAEGVTGAAAEGCYPLRDNPVSDRPSHGVRPAGGARHNYSPVMVMLGEIAALVERAASEEIRRPRGADRAGEDAKDREAVVADQLARGTDQDRREGRPPRSPRTFQLAAVAVSPQQL
jgi:hypothetical protein